MPLRHSLQRPIALAVIMLMLLGVLTVGWVLLNVLTALDKPSTAGWHWAFLVVGSTFILLLVVGVVLYLMLSLKAINLSRRQSNFIDSVTHELKSPLSSMKLYLQTLDRREVSQEQRETFRRFIREDIDRLDRLINQILDAGHLDSGQVEGETENVALAELLRGLRNSNQQRPDIIVAETVKGYGLKCMENVPKFHFRLPSAEELQLEEQ